VIRRSSEQMKKAVRGAMQPTLAFLAGPGKR